MIHAVDLFCGAGGLCETRLLLQERPARPDTRCRLGAETIPERANSQILIPHDHLLRPHRRGIPASICVLCGQRIMKTKIKQFEYETVCIDNRLMTSEELLQEKGRQGWQLCAVLRSESSVTKHFFMRELITNH